MKFTRHTVWEKRGNNILIAAYSKSEVTAVVCCLQERDNVKCSSAVQHTAILSNTMIISIKLKSIHDQWFTQINKLLPIIQSIK
jgi:hypothetical protein